MTRVRWPLAPAIVVVIELEEPVVVRSVFPREDYQRMLDWLNAGPPEVRDLVRRAAILDPRQADVADELRDQLEEKRDGPDDEHDDDERDDEDDAAMLWKTYANFPALSVRDLTIVPASWLEERGIQTDGGGVVGWPGYEFDPGAEYDEPGFRPDENWPPSLAEIEAAE